jgi:hypothetical protein
MVTKHLDVIKPNQAIVATGDFNLRHFGFLPFGRSERAFGHGRRKQSPGTSFCYELRFGEPLFII